MSTSLLRLRTPAVSRLLTRAYHPKPQIQTGARLPAGTALKDLEGRPFGELHRPGAGKRVIVSACVCSDSEYTEIADGGIDWRPWSVYAVVQ